MQRTCLLICLISSDWAWALKGYAGVVCTAAVHRVENSFELLHRRWRRNLKGPPIVGGPGASTRASIDRLDTCWVLWFCPFVWNELTATTHPVGGPHQHNEWGHVLRNTPPWRYQMDQAGNEETSRINQMKPIHEMTQSGEKFSWRVSSRMVASKFHTLPHSIELLCPIF